MKTFHNMDIKRVIQVLLRDIADLQHFVDEVKSEGSPGPTDLELISTRLSGVQHMLERSVEGVGALQGQLAAAGERIEALQAATVAAEKSHPLVKPDREPAVEAISIPKAEVEIKVPDEKPVVNTIAEEVKEIPAVESMAEPEELYGPEAGVKDESEDAGDGVGLVEEKADHAVLGERFSHSKSLNDMLLEQGKGDSKYSHMPIVSLQSAIGINDRFLFTRELFEGNAQHYQETMAKLDAMQNLQEAASFLRAHYTWKKSDTSLKFIELVRRRFQSA